MILFLSMLIFVLLTDEPNLAWRWFSGRSYFCFWTNRRSALGRMHQDIVFVQLDIHSVASVCLSEVLFRIKTFTSKNKLFSGTFVSWSLLIFSPKFFFFENSHTKAHVVVLLNHWAHNGSMWQTTKIYYDTDVLLLCCCGARTFI